MTTFGLTGSQAAAGTSVTIPTHAVGDLIVIAAYRSDKAVPSKPVASGHVPTWLDIDTTASNQTCSMRTAYCVATETGTTSGTWTSATGVMVAVITKQADVPIGGHSTGVNAQYTNGAVAPAIASLTSTNGTSLILGFVAVNHLSSWDAAPSGWTRQAAVAGYMCLNTKDDSTSSTDMIQTGLSGTKPYAGSQIEILAGTDLGTVATRLQPATAAATGVHIYNTIVSTLRRVLFAATGKETAQGTAATVLRRATAAMAGKQTQTGTATPQLKAATFSAGQQVITSTAAVTMRAPTAALAGKQTIVGWPFNPAMTAPVFDGAGAQTQQGEFAAEITAATAAATGEQIESGAFAARLPTMTALMLHPYGPLAASMRKATAAAAGAQTQTGALTVTAKTVRATFVGVWYIPPFGGIAVTLQKLRPVATGHPVQRGTIRVRMLPVETVPPGVEPPPPDYEPEGGTPVWAQSVTAFASAATSTRLLSSATQFQYPPTDQLGGLCGGLLGGSAFTGGLVADGDAATNGSAGALVGGTQNFADSLCGFLGGAGTGTTPQSITAGAADVYGAIGDNPMASGTIEMGQPGGATGNIALDAINGGQQLANTLFGILSACGCGDALAPTDVTPQQIVDTTQQTADGVTGNPMAAGIIGMGQDPSSGNVALDALNGMQTFANAIYNILGACGCADTNSPDQATPQAVIDTTQQTADAYNNSAMATGIVGIGQANGSSGNVAVDAINGMQIFANVLYAITSICGACNLGGMAGGTTAAGAGVLGPMMLGGSFATDVSPWDVIDTTQATANAISANPYARRYLGVSSSGNLGVDAVAAGGFALGENNAQHLGAMALTPATSVGLKDQNLLVSQDFGAEYTLAVPDDETHWSHDMTNGHLSPGSAKCICNGSQDSLISNEVNVIAGETVEVAAEVKWSGLTYTGSNPIVLGVQKYRQTRDRTTGGIVYSDIGHATVATVAAPGASSTGKGDDGGAWVGIAGTYVTEPGVDLLRVRLEPAHAITAGTVWWDETATLKTDLIADAAAPGIGLTVDDIVTQLYGVKGAGFTHNQSAIALANTAESLTSVSARIAALEAEHHLGAIAGDDFSWIGEPATSILWNGDYSAPGYGNYWADGVDCQWVFATRGATNAARFDWVGSDAVSNTDYQLIQLVLNSACSPATDNYGGILHSYIRLYGRVSADWSTSVMAQFGSDNTYSVGFWDAGAYTEMSSGSASSPGRGSTINFYLGDAATAAPRHFKLVVGGQTVCEFDEAGVGSRVGVSNRKWGWGGVAQGGTLKASGTVLFIFHTTHSYAAQATPATVNQWLAMDQ